MTPEQRATKNRKQRRYYRKHRSELLEQNRLSRAGRQHDWWKRACVKAGIPLSELTNL